MPPKVEKLRRVRYIGPGPSVWIHRAQTYVEKDGVVDVAEDLAVKLCSDRPNHFKPEESGDAAFFTTAIAELRTKERETAKEARRRALGRVRSRPPTGGGGG